MIKLYRRISFKIALLFTSIFFILFFLMGYMLYGLFSNLFVDYITQDLLTRGDNHAKVLEENFNQNTLTHVALMEKNVVTDVVVTDANHEVIIFSEPVTKDMENYLLKESVMEHFTINDNWSKEEDYIATVSPIAKGEYGYVYMFYPTTLLNETVSVLKLFMLIASIGVIMLAIGLIGYFSKKMTIPLLEMKEATNQMAEGNYQQEISVEGEDELAQLAFSIKSLGEQLQYFENTRSEFLAGVSHELRTPLTYIKGYSDILLKGIIKDKEEERNYLLIINEETKRVTNLVNDLFDVAKIQTGKYEIHKEQMDIKALLQKIVRSLSLVAEKKNIILQCEFLEAENYKPIYILADPDKISQVIYNLVENAIKYTEQGIITVGIKENDQDIKIIINDTGIGIPEKDIPHIWEGFYRVEKSRARQTGGSGLGLYVVKQIIQLHGGNIEVASVEGKGTTFTITFRKEGIV